MLGTLYLIPSTLGECCISDVLPQRTSEIVNRIAHYVVENTRSARRFLSKLNVQKDINCLSFSKRY